MTTRRIQPTLDSIAANAAWVDELLELFWTLDEIVKRDALSLPDELRTAYERAEEARQKL